MEWCGEKTCFFDVTKKNTKKNQKKEEGNKNKTTAWRIRKREKKSVCRA